MQKGEIWFERKFEFDFGVDQFSKILTRLNQTIPGIKSIVAENQNMNFGKQVEGRWSIIEHVGHLWDLEELWLGRLQDILNGVQVMRSADLTNRKTHEANHNKKGLEFVIGHFEQDRQVILERLKDLKPKDLVKSSVHPRLLKPMRIIDLFFFVAEHDDHHLRAIQKLMND